MLADTHILDPASIDADVGMTLDEWQADLLRSTAPRTLLCASRQSGKSTVVSLLASSEVARVA